MREKKNGPWFIGQGFKAFLARYNFYRIITSPQYPQAKAEAGRNVQTRWSFLGTATYRSAPVMSAK